MVSYRVSRPRLSDQWATLLWFVLNNVVLRSFSPLGSQGAIHLAAGCSDDAWRRRREWSAWLATLTSVEARLRR